MKKRQKQNEETYQLPKMDDNSTIVTTLQENDMFILGLADDDFQDNKNNQGYLTKNLFRVQKLSKKKNSFEFFFRHHLASTLNNEIEGVSVQSFKKWIELNPIKVSLTETGKIVII